MAIDWSSVASSAAGSLVGAISQIGANKKNRQFVERQNQINRDFTLDMWNRTNEYNSPVQQMARWKEAGLNPNLMYGQGSSGNAQASPTPAQGTPKNEPIDLSQFADMMFKRKQMQLSNINLQADTATKEGLQKVQESQVVNNLANAKNHLANAGKSEAEVGRINSLLQYEMDNLGAVNKNLGLTADKIAVDIQNVQQQMAESGQRMRLSQAQIGKIAQDIASAKAQMNLWQMQGNESKARATQLELHNKLIKEGVNPQDPAWLRILGRNADSIIDYGKDMFLKLWDRDIREDQKRAVNRYKEMKSKQRK